MTSTPPALSATEVDEVIAACRAVVDAVHLLDAARERRNAAAVALWAGGMPKRRVPDAVRAMLLHAGFSDADLLRAGVSDANLRVALDRR